MTASAGRAKTLFLAVLAIGGFSFAPASARSESARTRPNILFIAVDDLNDWVGPLDGHPATNTPWLDALADRGTTFLNAHCQAPICNPSRIAVLSGLRPSTTGVYGLTPAMRAVPALRERRTLIQRFGSDGYRTYVAGKVDHHEFKGGGGGLSAEADERGPSGGPGDIFPPQKLVGPTPMGNNPWMDWGAFEHDEARKGDSLVADWAIEKLEQHPDDHPFFMSLGFFLPHVPAYVTPEWLERVPLEGILPPVKPDDRDDVPPFAWYLHWELPEPRLAWMIEHEQWTPFVRAYLAAISWIDAQIGTVLAKLEARGLAENTVVVLWGDNGFHLGEKGITGKNSLWERSTRVPLIFAGPGIARGGRVTTPAELVDIYPTLVELAGMPDEPGLDGLSLVPSLRDPSAVRERPALTTANPGNHAVRSERYRYIRYADGSEEFYDLLADPNEWRNLAANPLYANEMARHRTWLPASDHPHLPGSGGRTLDYDPATGRVLWEGKLVPRGSPVPR